MRILLVAPCFSPRMVVGAKRFSFIGEQFERQGHEVEVLARRIRQHEAQDPTLPQPERVHWISSVFPHHVEADGLFSRIYNRILVSVIGMPDPEIGWLPSSIIAGRRIGRRFEPDVIIATGPPFTAFLTGSILSRSVDAPLILDYRDPWTAFDWPDTPQGRLMKSPRRRRLEKWAVESAGAAVFATESMQERFAANFDGRAPRIQAVITNGFEEPLGLEPKSIFDGGFNVIYAGSMYGERKVANLAIALKQLTHRRDVEPGQFAVHIFGRIGLDDREKLKAESVEHLVHEHAPVAHREIRQYMKGADALFLPSGGDVFYALPFKTFDYLSVCRPILAVTPPGSALAKFMGQVDCGEVAYRDDVVSIADALQRLMTRACDYSFAGRENFTWQEVANRYIGLAEEVVASLGRSRSQSTF